MPPNQTAVCNGWGCHFGSGEPSWVCDTVVCECPNGCASGGQDYMETFKNVRGEVTLDCEKKTDKCLLNVSRAAAGTGCARGARAAAAG